MSIDSLFSSDSTDFAESPFHLITTNHPYMATLGLSQFTTGTLYRWWNKKNGQGKNENRKYFAENPDTLQDDHPSLILLGTDTSHFIDKTDKGINQFVFQAWRRENEAGAGQYVTKYIDGGHAETWNFFEAGLNERGNPRSYTYAQLNLDEYNDFFLVRDPDDSTNLLHDNIFEIPNGKGGKSIVDFKGISPITNVIALNDYVNNLEYSSIARDQWTPEQFARYEFISDIQAAKSQGGGLGYVEWSGYVPFYITLNRGTQVDFKCAKSDWVKYRLYLYANGAPKSSRRGIALASPTFAGPPVDALGRKYQYKEDGKFSAFPEGSPVAEVVGQLDMTFNEYTGKWEAGSKQMVAVVTQTIPRAQVLSAQALRNLAPEEMLKNPNDPNSHIIFGSGAAMPLNMQNGNPMQWTPNYAQPADVDENGKFVAICPEKTQAKATLRVFNASAKSIETNQMVLLNQIDGVWFAMDFPSGIEGAAVQAGFDGKWEFSYSATNLVHYFRDKMFNRIDSDWVWQGFHRKYYSELNDVWNKDTYIRMLTDTTTNQQFEWTIDYLTGGGYHQFTSFDFMDSGVAGTRAYGNALGVTDPIIAPNGDPVQAGEGDPDGNRTGAFFGCMFPDGYYSEDVAEYKVDRNFKVLPTIAVSGKIDGKWISLLSYSSDYKYFHPTGIDKTGRPFDAGPIRHDYTDGLKSSVDGTEVPMFTDSDTSLSNLPADIATNACPSGLNGQPIKNIHFIDDLYRGFPTVKTTDFFLYGQNWLYRKYDDGIPNVPDFINSSAFDFKPKVPNRLIFRPLKAEAYAQFASIEYNPTAVPDTRQYFCQSIAKRMKNNKRAASDISYQREFNSDVEFTNSYGQGAFSVPGMLGNITNIYNSRWGLQCNIDIPYEKTPSYKISPNAYFKDPNNNDFERFDWKAWGFENNLWCHGGSSASPYRDGVNPSWKKTNGYAPAYAVGIIGAVATCTANNNIKFQTDNRLGSMSWLDLANMNAIKAMPTWGKADGYRSFNTTNLYVKIYHQWPRHQIIYDPRYFAVHHFNPGTMDINVSDIRITSEKIRHNDGMDYDYSIHQTTYDVDTRVPCAKSLTTTGSITPKVLGLDAKVYGNTAIDNSVKYESLSKDKWNIDIQRRAKLLPYKYAVDTVVIPQVVVSLPYDELVYNNGGYAILADSTVVPFFNVQNQTTRDFDPFNNPNDDTQDVVMIVKSPGTEGYKIGDTFTCSDKTGAGLLIEVTNVDANGRVSEFRVANPGYDFSYTGFANIAANQKITNKTNGIAVFTGGAQISTGKGFNLHLIRGTVAKAVLEDVKPSIATSAEYNLISIKSNKNDESGRNGEAAKTFGLDTGTFELDLEVSNPSDNKKYDLFFHFHNDISHTFMTDEWVGAGCPYNNHEQYVDVTITTN